MYKVVLELDDADEVVRLREMIEEYTSLAHTQRRDASNSSLVLSESVAIKKIQMLDRLSTALKPFERQSYGY